MLRLNFLKIDKSKPVPKMDTVLCDYIKQQQQWIDGCINRIKQGHVLDIDKELLPSYYLARDAFTNSLPKMGVYDINLMKRNKEQLTSMLSEMLCRLETIVREGTYLLVCKVTKIIMGYMNYNINYIVKNNLKTLP